MLKGIDVSYYQSNIDFNVLKSQIDFIIIRASYGVGYTDKCFKSYRDKARELGIPCGFYHYAYPQYNLPEDEAKWFLQTVGTLQAGEILVLDFEENWSGDVVDWCKRFLDYISAQLDGYKSLIYLNRSTIKSYNWSSVVNAGYSLWLAAYDNDPDFIDFPTPWPSIPFKQYTDKGSVAGIAGNVDLNTFFGDLNTLKSFGYYSAIITEPVIQDPLVILPPVVQNTPNQVFVASLKERKFVLSVVASLTAFINSLFNINLTPTQLFWIIAPILSLAIADGLVDIYKRRNLLR